ncbi:MAG: hypothetical protein ACREBU_23495, partial [Nitrososphaera sp.]
IKPKLFSNFCGMAVEAHMQRIAPNGATEDQFAFVSANAFMHEVVHSIEDRAPWRSFPEHESTGLMRGTPWSNWGWTQGSAGLIPFSSTTEDRLKTAMGNRK